MASSKIEWTEASWNPLTGCTKISNGCMNCYAERMANRLQAMGSPNYSHGFKLTMHEHILTLPLSWNVPRFIFVNSMSDLFHEDVPLSFIEKVFSTMKAASHHTFQILTKRSSRLLKVSQQLPWPKNIWIGVTVEDDAHCYRIDNLNKVEASTRFISFEPLLTKIGEIPLEGIDWVIAGGESGPRARAMHEDWVVGIRDQCIQNGIPFFFKQWGGVHKKRAGHILEGKVWHQMPHAYKALPRAENY